MRIKIFLATGLVMSVAACASAQVIGSASITATSSACSTANSCASFSPGSAPAVTFDVSGTFSATLDFEATANGTSWTSVKPLNLATLATAATTTTTGTFAISNSGFIGVRVRASAYTSGTANITATRGFTVSSNSSNTITGDVTVGDIAITSIAAGDNNIGNVDIASSVLPTGAATSAKQPALGTAGSASTDVITIQGIASGTVVPVSAASLPLPSGAATSAKQPALGVAGTASTDVITIQGIASGTVVPVSAASLPLPSGASTSAKQPALGTAGTASTDVITIQGIASGTVVPVSDGGGSLTVDGSVTALGSKTNNNAAPGATNIGALIAIANAAAPSWTEGNLVGLSTDLAGALRIAGSISCSNCSGTGVSVNEDTAAANLDPGTPAYAVRKATPANTSSADGDYEALQISAGRLWVDASGVTLTVAAHAVTNAGTFAVQADTEISAAATLADNTTNPSLGGIAAYMMCFDGSTWDRCLSGNATELTHDAAMTASSTIGTANLLLAKDFDGSALPNVVSAEGDAVLPAASLYGVQYMMLVSEDGSLQYGTSTTPLVVGDGSGALNVICDSGCSGGTQYTHDAALTIGSSLTTLAGARASAAVPTNVSADNDAVALWALPSGALANQPTYGGVLGVAGNGLSGTGVQRVTIASDSTGQVALAAGSATIGALTANQSVNIAQLNGVTPLLNAGNTGTGSLRVTIATDQAALAGMGVGATAAAPPANANYTGGVSSGATGGLLTPLPICDSQGSLNMTTATTTEIAPLVSSRTIYICSIYAQAGGTTTMTIKRGTGTDCGTGTASISPGFELTAQNGAAYGSGVGVILGPLGAGTVGGGTTSGNAVCVTSSAAVNLHVLVRYGVW